MTSLCVAAMSLVLPLARGETWQEAAARMPLATNTVELTRLNAVPLLLASFKKNETIKALVLLPGATDEFYFFRRAHAHLDQEHPTLLDALTALTNQTHIEVTFQAPFLLVHSMEDPLDPIIKIEDEKLAARYHTKAYRSRVLMTDLHWDFVIRDLEFYLNRRVTPPKGSSDAFHFFRNNMSAYDLTDWEMLEALCWSGRITATIKKHSLLFAGDTRIRQLPPLDVLPFNLPPGTK